jgi:ribonuclease HII
VTLAARTDDQESWPPLACGVDEVGRGALAGPLVAAAVVLDPVFRHPLLRDSKRLTPGQRERLEPLIRTAASTVEVVEVGPDLIDLHGIGWANRTAFEQLMVLVDAPLFLLDGNLKLSSKRPYRSVVHGDDLVPAISAASIVAKVWRDRLMRRLDPDFPHYGWAGNKGYGSARHLEAIARHGPSPLHRRSFLHRADQLSF